MASALASCLCHDPTPGLGYPLRWLQDHLPSFLLRSSEPAAYGFTPISPVNMSSPFSHLPIAQGEPADSSSGAPCNTHCGSLKAPWERPLQSPPHPVSSSLPAGGGCAPLCRAAPWGFEEPMLPHPCPPQQHPPQHVSPWAPGPALPGVIPQSLAPLLNLGMQGAPQLYPCTPSLSTGTRLVSLLCSWLSMPSVCPQPQVHPELSESSPGCRTEHSAALLTRPRDTHGLIHLNRAEARLLASRPGSPPHLRKQALASSCSGLSPGSSLMWPALSLVPTG